MAPTDPIALGDGVWWVGTRLADDTFQSHSYLVRHGEGSVLVDPGSPLTIHETLAKVAALVPLESVGHLVCHHPDPDIAASLPWLSEQLPRDDVVVVTEWRARALLKHYGHRFDYWLIEEHDWHLPLGPRRHLEFQLTPYLHFPGAFMSFDTGSRTLFSSDIFGGFVVEGADLIAPDVGTALEAMAPFHQHYMPSRALLSGALARVQARWPDIERIAPQHGHVLEGPHVDDAFRGLSRLDCGVFALSDHDHELERLLRIADARSRLTESLLAVAEPSAVVSSVDAVLVLARPGTTAALYLDVPDDGWTRWTTGSRVLVAAPPAAGPGCVVLEGEPEARLALDLSDGRPVDEELAGTLEEIATSIRPSIDQYVAHVQDSHRIAALRRDARTDPLTGLANRRALDDELPAEAYALVALDIDRFKAVNDDFGHASGDHVLQQVGLAILGSIRDGDRAYRLGGEEFLVVAPGSDLAGGVDIAERIRAAVASTDLTDAAPRGRVTISAGVAAVDARDDVGFAAVLAAADGALYRSKSAGRDRVSVATLGP